MDQGEIDEINQEKLEQREEQVWQEEKLKKKKFKTLDP